MLPESKSTFQCIKVNFETDLDSKGEAGEA